MRTFTNTPEPEPGPLGRGLTALMRVLGGIGIFLGAILALLSLAGIAFFAVLMFSLFSSGLPGWENDVLPPKIATTRVLFSSAERGGYLEGCWLVVYRLAPATVGEIRKQGGRFFDGMPPAPGDSEGRYREWRDSPVPKDTFASHAQNGCGDDSNESDSIRRLAGPDPLEQPGGYYSLTGNREGLILVLPERGVAIYMYFG